MGGVGWGGVGWGGACVNVHVNLLGKWTQVKVRCKVVWQVVPNSSIHNMLKSRSVARSSGRLCQLHQYITCGITKKCVFA